MSACGARGGMLAPLSRTIVCKQGKSYGRRFAANRMGADSPQPTHSHANTAAGERQNNKATLEPPQMDASVSPVDPMADAAALLALAIAAPGPFTHVAQQQHSARSRPPQEVKAFLRVPTDLTHAVRLSCVCFMLSAAAPREHARARPVARAPLKDAQRRQLCEECRKPLAKLKGQQYHNPKGDKIEKVCQGCYDIIHNRKAAFSAPSSPAAPRPSKKRSRASSDPGQQSNADDWDTTRAQVAAWEPDPHLAAALAAEQREWAARTPAQWARRHYLLHAAPRCQRCHFPRTGKKGWDEKHEYHMDKHCNDNRWRVLDAFC